MADFESHNFEIDPDIECKLDYRSFNIIASAFGTPEVDVFANARHTKCNKYFTMESDDCTLGVDVLNSIEIGHIFVMT